MRLLALCLLLVGGANRARAAGNLTVDGGERRNGSRLLSIGDGSWQEFEFPENTEGVIVVSSRYRGGRVRVRSLDPEVLSVLNVTEAAAGSFVISIRSGFPGRAPLRLQLLGPGGGGGGGGPVLVEESADYVIRVEAAEDEPRPGGLAHFTENPVLFALLPLIFVNKCAFGCKVEVAVLRGLLRAPGPLLLGVLAQFLVMPLYAYGAARLLALPRPLALGLVITCSAPGGGGGYLYSLLLGGDVTLAISMTLVSTLVAAAAMPLSSALYGRLLGVRAALHVPFVKIAGTLLFIAVPISLGMLVKLRLPGLTRVLLLLIRPFSLGLMLGGVFMAYQMGASILADVRPPIVAVGLTVPPLGLLVGGVLARAAGLAAAQRRTVSIEVGVQNSLLALAVMQLSFRRLEADFASQAPFIVALSSTSEMLLIVLGRFAQRRLCAGAAAERRSDA